MGFVLSKFRKEKSTTAVLEGLQLQIQDLEKYVINTQEQKRRFVSNFVGFTIGAYIVGFALWYFFYFPPTMQERIMYLVPLLLFPLLIIFLRQMFTWYFQRKLNKNGDKLAQLKQKKTKILEQVMDKETYKVAVQLLERFGDKQQSRISGLLSSSTARSLNQSSNSLNRSVSSSLQRTPQPAGAAAAAAAAQRNMLTPYTGVYRNMNNNNVNTSVVAPQMALNTTPQTRSTQVVRRRTPFPVVDESSRSALDRFVDFIVGDSPQNRFGMICKECHRHNGMLPMEEYEYTTFHCAFCGALNPARKERPVAPRLSLNAAQSQTPTLIKNGSSDSDSSDDEDEDSEDNKHLARRALHKELPSTDTDADMDMEVDEADAEADAEPTPATATKTEETESAASQTETEAKAN
ncbi:endoplasmic reticulum junction formation protein lunapark-A isoform X2 [Drosophila navojoa]|uniref:endoplasmic reticulum junction formation protein lunapark-A isoform X2 n=1 Tax=Drosophila navojoa TaxID=7232 RepID=UPI000847697C|nr:endoplasmic reticulum junction formation protein lunapark-A isoform X2 [Drosophila navojoa]